MDYSRGLSIDVLNVLQTGTYTPAGRSARAALQQFVRQKTNPKVAAGRVHPIHHLLILWEWKTKVMLINQQTPSGK